MQVARILRRKALKKKTVKVKSGKLIFTKKAAKGKYVFKVTTVNSTTKAKVTKKITIRVK